MMHPDEVMMYGSGLWEPDEGTLFEYVSKNSHEDVLVTEVEPDDLNQLLTIRVEHDGHTYQIIVGYEEIDSKKKDGRLAQEDFLDIGVSS